MLHANQDSATVLCMAWEKKSAPMNYGSLISIWKFHHILSRAQTLSWVKMYSLSFPPNFFISKTVGVEWKGPLCSWASGETEQTENFMQHSPYCNVCKRASLRLSERYRLGIHDEPWMMGSKQWFVGYSKRMGHVYVATTVEHFCSLFSGVYNDSYVMSVVSMQLLWWCTRNLISGSFYRYFWLDLYTIVTDEMM